MIVEPDNIGTESEESGVVRYLLNIPVFHQSTSDLSTNQGVLQNRMVGPNIGIFPEGVHEASKEYQCHCSGCSFSSPQGREKVFVRVYVRVRVRCSPLHCSGCSEKRDLLPRKPSNASSEYSTPFGLRSTDNILFHEKERWCLLYAWLLVVRRCSHE